MESGSGGKAPARRNSPHVSAPKGLLFVAVSGALLVSLHLAPAMAEDTTPPVADAGADQTVNEADRATFDASGSNDPDGTIVKYEWDWTSDGTYDRDTGGTPNATHAYAAPGVYAVTVRVTNDAGMSDTDSAVVTVADIPGLSFARLTSDPGSEIQAEYDHGGTRIVWAAPTAGNPDIWVMNADGTGKTQLTTDPSADQHPSFSPDGTRIAFMSQRSGAGDIYVMDADGSGQLRLTSDAALDGFPNFSPDGSRIAFASARGGTSDIWVMDADGSNQTQLTSDAANETLPDWSPDGSRIAFTSDKAGSNDVWIMDADGTDQVRLTEDPGIDQHPSFRGDGSRIIFFSTRTGNQDLFTMKPDGTDVRQLTSSPGGDWVPYWAKSADKAVYSTTSEGNDDIWSVTFDHSPPVTTLGTDPSTPNGSNGWYVTDPTVTLTRDEPGTTYYSFDSDSGPWTVYSGAFAVGEGSKTLYYYSEDAAGNAEAVKTQSFKVDTIAPMADIWTPAPETTISGGVIVDGVADDPNFSDFTLEYGAGRRPLTAGTIGPYKQGTWWRQVASSASPVVGGMLAFCDTAALDNSYHTLRLVVRDQAGNTAVRLVAGRVENEGRPWLDEVTIDAFDWAPDVSADGSRIAFSSDRLGSLDIWIASSDGTLIGALAASPAEDRHPSFSPDGQSVVFMSDRGGDFDIWKVNLDGSGLTRLTSGTANETVPTWSHDGSRIVFASDAAGNRDIWIMNADGSGQTQLTTDPGHDELADISPDGSKVAFQSMQYGTRDILLVNTDGTGLTRVTSLPDHEYHPSFSPDGQTLAFYRWNGGNPDIWTVGVDGGQLRRLTNDPALDMLPSWSPDGTRILFASTRTGLCDIYSMNPDGSAPQRLSFSVDDFIPDVNADSSRIAFASNRARDNLPVAWYDSPRGDVFLVDPDGTDMSRVGTLPSYSSHPSFSPDGQQLAFVSDMDGAWDVWKMNLDGTGLTQLTSGVARDQVPTWGPAGKIVYDSNANGNDDVFIMNADGSGQSAVTVDAANDRWADVAPTGQIVAFTSNRFGPGDVFTAAPDGTNVTRLTPSDAVNEWHPSFSPGGTKLAFQITGPGLDVFAMNVDGSGVEQLTYDPALDGVPTWGAEGTTLVFSTSRTSGDSSRKSIWRMAMESDAPADVTPPVTTVSRDPAVADGADGWYRSPLSVTLARDEPGSTYYQWDGTDPGGWTLYSGAVVAPQGAHTLNYYSIDVAGNAETAGSAALKVDGVAPTAPTLSVSAVDSTSITLAWTASTDTASGVGAYRVYSGSNGSLLKTVSGLSTTLSGLSPACQYSYFVRGVDAAGNVSPPSATVSAATEGQEVSDVGTGSQVSVVSGIGATLTFTGVTSPGTVSFTQLSSPSHQAPANFRLVGGSHYEISTTAAYTGYIQVVVPYDPADVRRNENNLKLFHWQGSGWEDVTVSVDTVANTITGRVTSLSPFSAGESTATTPTPTPASSAWAIAMAVAIGAAGLSRAKRGVRRT